jgi:hypothetical protein
VVPYNFDSNSSNCLPFRVVFHITLYSLITLSLTYIFILFYVTHTTVK